MHLQCGQRQQQQQQWASATALHHINICRLCLPVSRASGKQKKKKSSQLLCACPRLSTNRQKHGCRAERRRLSDAATSNGFGRHLQTEPCLSSSRSSRSDNILCLIIFLHKCTWTFTVFNDILSLSRWFSNHRGIRLFLNFLNFYHFKPTTAGLIF